MRRAGLALTGAQSTFDAWAKNQQTVSENDGILTAEEAALLDLQGTWLTTLSACETGNGNTQAGEGVFGLGVRFIKPEPKIFYSHFGRSVIPEPLIL